MYEELSVLWMYEPDDMPARQDMDLSTADYYCGLWKLESLLDHLARENAIRRESYLRSAPHCNGQNTLEYEELFELEPWMIVKDS